MNVISPIVSDAFFLALGFAIGFLVMLYFRHVPFGRIGKLWAAHPESAASPVGSLPIGDSFWNTTAETVHAGLGICDPQSKFLFVNVQLADMLGYSPHEMAGSLASDFIPTSQEMSATFSDIPFRHKDGSSRWASVSATPAIGKDNQRIGTLMLVVDITERKHAEIDLRQANTDLTAHVEEQSHELQARQAEFDAVLGAMGEGVFYSKGQYIRYANRALEEMSGYTSGELVGKLGRILLTTDMESPNAIDIVVAVRQGAFSNPNRVWRGETKLMRKDGTTYDGALTFTLLLGPEDQITGAVCRARHQ